MAELTYSRRELFTSGGSSGGGSGEGVSLEKRTLIRTAGTLDANTSIAFNAPGPGWIVTGDSVTLSGTSDFLEKTQTFHNGQLILPGASATDNNDVYYLSDTSFAFEFPVVKNDVIQIWHFTTSSG